MSENEEIEENYFECQYCHCTFDSEDERDNHVFQVHMNEVQEKLSQIRDIAKSEEKTLGSWREKLKLEILEEIARDQPQRLYSIRIHPEQLEKLCDERIFKMALRTKMPNSFDLMWMKDKNWDRIAKEVKVKEEEDQREAEIQKELKRVNERELTSLSNLGEESKYMLLKQWLQSKRTQNRRD